MDEGEMDPEGEYDGMDPNMMAEGEYAMEGEYLHDCLVRSDLCG